MRRYGRSSIVHNNPMALAIGRFRTIVVSTLTFVAGWYVSYFRIKNALKREGIEMSLDSVLYPEDQKKIEEAVQYFPMGSYQIGEIARLSALLYNEGIDVEKRLIEMCKTYGIKLEELGFNLSKPMTLSSDD